MKFILKTIAALALLTGGAALMMSLGGCAAYQQALETYERNAEAFEAAGAELKEAEQILMGARQEYVNALKDNDADKISAALEAVKAAEAQRQEKQLDFDATRLAIDQAKRELENNKSPTDWITDGLGMLLAVLVGGGGGYLGGKRGGRVVAEQVTGKKK